MRARLAHAAALLAVSTACVDGGDADLEIAEHDEAMASAGDGERWPLADGNVVYYYIDRDGEVADEVGDQEGCTRAVAGNGVNESDPGNEATIRLALDRYEAQTPLRFEEVFINSWFGEPVLFFTGGGIDNAAGDLDMPDGSLSDYASCVVMPAPGPNAVTVTERLVQHEIGHNIGLIHEQARSDRDDYGNVMVAHVSCFSADGAGNYTKSTSSINLSPYDLESIMEYDSGMTANCSGTYDVLIRNCTKLDACCTSADPTCNCPLDTSAIDETQTRPALSAAIARMTPAGSPSGSPKRVKRPPRRTSSPSSVPIQRSPAAST